MTQENWPLDTGQDMHSLVHTGTHPFDMQTKPDLPSRKARTLAGIILPVTRGS